MKQHSPNDLKVSPRQSAQARVASQSASSERVPVLSPSQERQTCRRLVQCRLEMQSLVLQTPLGLTVLESALGAMNATPQQLEILTSLASLQHKAKTDWVQLETDAEASDEVHVRLERFRQEVAEVLTRACLPEEIQERLLLAGCRREPGLVQPAPMTAAKRCYLESRIRRTEQEMQQLRAHLIAANQGLVRFVVKRYAGMGLSLADLMQEGNIGLMRAVDKFDVERGVPFNSYAVWWIRQSARRALSNQSRTIRLPVHAFDARTAVAKAQTRLQHELGREPSAQDLEHELGLTASAIERALTLVREPLSLEAPRGSDGDFRLLDSLADTEQSTSDAGAWANQRRLRLERLLAELTPREASMMRMRFGLVEGKDEYTLEEIGNAFGLTRERARQIVDAGLGKLRRAAARQGIDLS